MVFTRNSGNSTSVTCGDSSVLWTLMSLRDVCGSVGAPIEGEQEGENPAFRAGKGQEFPTCEAQRGQRESKGAKRYEGST